MNRPTLRIGRTAVTTGLLVSVVLLAAASPAFGGPSLSTLRKSVATALKLARGADARSRKALALAGRAAPQGARGPAGPAGPAGGAGASGGTSGVAAQVTVIDFRENPGTSRVVYDHGGLTLTASCASGPTSAPTISVTAKTSVDHAMLHAANVISTPTASNPEATTTELVQKNDFLIGGPARTLVSSGHLEGTATYSTPTGTVTTLDYGAEQGAFGAGSARGCWFGGTASTGA